MIGENPTTNASPPAINERWLLLMMAAIQFTTILDFLSINSSVQQFSSGVAAYVSGQIISQASGGAMTHFPLIGLISVACGGAGIYLVHFVKTPTGPDLLRPPLVVEQW